MLNREKVALCCEIRTEHINYPRGWNVDSLNVKPGGTQSSHWALRI